MKKKIVLFGAGGHAESVAGVVEAEGKYEIAGFIDSIQPVGSRIFGYRVLGREDDLRRIAETLDVNGGLVCIGDNFQRRAFSGRIKAKLPDFSFIVSIHPAAAVTGRVSIGQGTVVMAQAAINPGCRIGEGCIVNTKASLDHGSVIEDFSSLGPGATTGGRASVGLCSAVGLGACVLEKAKIGNHTVIGAGALVVKDIGHNVVAFGVPAKVVRERNPDEPYLR